MKGPLSFGRGRCDWSGRSPRINAQDEGRKSEQLLLIFPTLVPGTNDLPELGNINAERHNKADKRSTTGRGSSNWFEQLPATGGRSQSAGWSEGRDRKESSQPVFLFNAFIADDCLGMRHEATKGKSCTTVMNAGPHS